MLFTLMAMTNQRACSSPPLLTAPRRQGSPTNFRSSSPKPTSSQHSNSRENSFTLVGRRPFAPRSAADIQLGDAVKFSRQGGKISRGVVMYVGHLPNKNDTYLGVELEHEVGKHNGVYEGTRYFQCKPNRGVFVAFSKVVMAWGNPVEQTL